MKTLKITVKQCLMPVAVIGGLHLMSYLPARSTAVQETSSTTRDIRDDRGDGAFKTKIFFGKDKPTNPTGASAAFHGLIDYYGG